MTREHEHEASYRYPMASSSGIESGTCACGARVSRPAVDGVSPAANKNAWTSEAERIAAASSDPLLTGPEAAARIGITAGTWRSYVKRGYAPAADVPDDERPANRRSPRWLASTVDHFTANRRGQGRRTCDAQYVTRGNDPYGTDCALSSGHAGPHRGADPFGSSGLIEWSGGGSCAGDPLPYRNVRTISANDNAKDSS